MADLPKREVHGGRFSFENNWDRPCICGHTLGRHLAERSRDPDGVTRQECMENSCACETFTPAKRRRSSKVAPKG